MRSGRPRRGGLPRPRAPENDSAVRSLRDLVAFRRGKVIERLETHHLEEPHRRSVELWLARSSASRSFSSAPSIVLRSASVACCSSRTFRALLELKRIASSAADTSLDLTSSEAAP